MVVVVGISACHKEPDKIPEEVIIPFEYISLTSAKDTADSGETIQLTATAKGNGLQYKWSSSAGGLQEDGKASVNFIGSACCAKEYEISCRVKDNRNDSAIKKITVYVRE